MSFFTQLPRELYSPQAFKDFNCANGDFDLGVARAMAWMCQLAYETDDPDKIDSIATDWTLTILHGGIISKLVATILPKSSTQLIVAERDGAAIIAFAGTDPLRLVDWATDFDIRPTATGAASGFASAAQSVAAEIETLLTGPLSGKPVFVTGHSLGGALAALAAQEIERARAGSVRAVYTFGMPRTGNATFSDSYNAVLGSRTYRLVHADDIVPMVPPSSVQQARHVGRVLRCERLGKFDAGALSAVGSNEPELGESVKAQLKQLRDTPFSGVISAAQRAKLVTALTLGKAPAGMRTDAAGIMIETLPPPVRDHLPDRYIAATG